MYALLGVYLIEIRKIFDVISCVIWRQIRVTVRAMGITGLLPFLKGIQKQMNIASFRGKKVAVDAYCWLHRGAYSCPMQLVMGPNEGEKIESL